VHFPLHPDTPAEGQTLEQLFAGRGFDREAAYAQMKARMDEAGLAYSARTHTYNSRLAQELGKWADTQPNGDVIHNALYKAYFVDGKNIGSPAVLLEIAEGAGLDTDQAAAVLADRTFKDAVDADWARSRQYGVTGVPTFVAGGYGVVGAQPYEVLAELMVKAGANQAS